MRTFNTNYCPRQPSIENKSLFRRYPIPHNHPLYGIVWEFYQYDVLGERIENVLILPDACTDLLFYYTSTGIYSYIVGSFLSLSATKYAERTTIFGIRFVSGAAYSVCCIPANNYLAKFLECAEIHKYFEEWNSLMLYCDTFENRVKTCEHKIASLLEINDALPLLVNYSVASITNSQGNLSINKLSENTGYSTRYIQRLFEKYVGISPKVLCEIVRFQNSLNILISNPKSLLSEVAWDSGYYDLSHMNKSYVNFVSNLPKSLNSLLLKD